MERTSNTTFLGRGDLVYMCLSGLHKLNRIDFHHLQVVFHPQKVKIFNNQTDILAGYRSITDN